MKRGPKPKGENVKEDLIKYHHLVTSFLNAMNDGVISVTPEKMSPEDFIILMNTLHIHCESVSRRINQIIFPRVRVTTEITMQDITNWLEENDVPQTNENLLQVKKNVRKQVINYASGIFNGTRNNTALLTDIDWGDTNATAWTAHSVRGDNIRIDEEDTN